MQASSSSSSVYLNAEQVDKLRRVLTPIIPIYPSPPTSTFPTLHITPRDFLRDVLIRLKENGIEISSVHLHGGAASYVLINDSDFIYRDIDILFHVKTPLSSEQQTTLFSSNNQSYLCDVWTIIKYVVSSCLIKYMPNTKTCTQYFVSSILDVYTKKNIQITSEQASWALLSLQNLLGQNLELKFVENLKRQWQFSVDSFQIDIKPILVEKINTSSVRMISTNNLLIGAINGLTILNRDQTKEHDLQPGPLEFGFFTPSSSPNGIPNYDHKQYQTLATITTIETSSANNHGMYKIIRKDQRDHCLYSETSQSRSRSPKLSNSPAGEDDQSDSTLQFQFSINEDVDDGIEADVGDSTNEDDEQQFRTPSDAESSSNVDSSHLPQIQVHSFYKDLNEALHHLNNKIIATYEPETIRGGGLLKYCDLLARNYQPYDAAIMTHMQRYMCSRFFIDYKTVREQLHVIAHYIGTHYLPTSITTNFYTANNSSEISYIHYHLQHRLMNARCDSEPIDQINLINARFCLGFLKHLIDIIQQSTVCLTHEDRELLLYNICLLRDSYHFEYERLFQNDAQHFQKYYPCNFSRYSSTNSSRSVSVTTNESSFIFVFQSSPSSLSSKSHGSYRPHAQRNHRYPTSHSRMYSNNQSSYRQRPS